MSDPDRGPDRVWQRRQKAAWVASAAASEHASDATAILVAIEGPADQEGSRVTILQASRGEMREELLTAILRELLSCGWRRMSVNLRDTIAREIGSQRSENEPR